MPLFPGFPATISIDQEAAVDVDSEEGQAVLRMLNSSLRERFGLDGEEDAPDNLAGLMDMLAQAQDGDTIRRITVSRPPQGTQYDSSGSEVSSDSEADDEPARAEMVIRRRLAPTNTLHSEDQEEPAPAEELRRRGNLLASVHLDGDLDGGLEDDMTCPICLDVLVDAVEPMGCDHAFCRRCLVQHLERGKRCPQCRCSVDASRVKPAHRWVKAALNKLHFRCPECQERVPYNKANTHLESSCSQVVASCPHAGCSIKLKRKHLEEHCTSDCARRNVVCQQCSARLLACELRDHRLTDCPETLAREASEDAQRMTDMLRRLLVDVQELKRKERMHQKVMDAVFALPNMMKHSLGAIVVPVRGSVFHRSEGDGLYRVVKSAPPNAVSEDGLAVLQRMPFMPSDLKREDLGDPVQVKWSSIEPATSERLMEMLET